MKQVGRNRPRNYKTAAHHIVAGTAKNAEKSRKILEQFNISINHEANGVFLTIERGSSYSAHHPSLHSNAYHDKVYRMLERATSREEALDVLRQIGDLLSRNKF